MILLTGEAAAGGQVCVPSSRVYDELETSLRNEILKKKKEKGHLRILQCRPTNFQVEKKYYVRDTEETSLHLFCINFGKAGLESLVSDSFETVL